MRTVPITQNLALALRHLRQQLEPRVLWVDALCIDQFNNDEKSKQVALMGLIYSSANRVIVWLGPEKNQSSEALAVLDDMSNEVEIDWRTMKMRSSSHCSSEDWANPFMTLPFKPSELLPVITLFERPYFRRAWIRQEIVLARDAIVHCGLRKISWQSFRRSVICLRLKPIATNGLQQGLWIRFSEATHALFCLCQITRGQYRFVHLRFSQQLVACQDSRDRIYSVLSLLCDNDRLLRIEPNYNLPVEDLFTDVAQRILRRMCSLSFLNSCHQASNVLRLPSWVPDWSACHPKTQPPSTSWSACAWISAQGIIRDDRLYATGVTTSRIDTVIDLNIGQPENAWDTTLMLLRRIKPADTRDATPDMLRQVLRKYCLAVTNYSPTTFEIPLEDLMQALEFVWSSPASWAELEAEYPVSSVLARFLTNCHHTLLSRSFMLTSHGYVGAGPADAQMGDIVCILLGCGYPILLRRVQTKSSSSLWNIIGSALVPGLMHGEAIYGRELFDRCRPVHKNLHGGDLTNLIDGFAFALYDTTNNVLLDDPGAILEDVGIKVQSYQRWPHKLEVSPESLRTAGVLLEEFVVI
jgi:hypothetical protein